MNKLITVLVAIVFIISSTITLKAQNDCCGLGSIFQSLVQSGIYGGYGIQQYSAEGLNYYYENDNNFSEFGTAYGWRVGANLVGFRQRDFLFTMKFYYQSVNEKQEATGTYLGNPATQELNLKLSQLGLGMGFAYVLGPNFDFKLLDIYIIWNGANFTNTIKTDNAPPKQEFKSPESSIGFSANTGVVWYPFPPYLSIEVIGGYSMFSVEKVTLTGGSDFPTNNADFVDGGGLFAMAVLTIGIPFN